MSELGHLVRSLSLTYRSGFATGAHQHPWGQLIFARSGIMEVRCQDAAWTVPPTRAAWIPLDVPHEIVIRGEVALRTLYLAPDQAALVPSTLGVIEVSPLLAALIAHIAAIGMLEADNPKHIGLAGVLVDLICDANRIDLLLPMPHDLRARRLAHELRDHPQEATMLIDVARRCGASLRTLERIFLSELGMSVGAWRQKARLICASAALAEGSSVTQTALDCGYGSVSAFIAAFRKQFGTTPGRLQRRRPDTRT